MKWIVRVKGTQYSCQLAPPATKFISVTLPPNFFQHIFLFDASRAAKYNHKDEDNEVVEDDNDDATYQFDKDNTPGLPRV